MPQQERADVSMAELLDRHAAGCAAARRIGEAVRLSRSPYLCPTGAMAVLRWWRVMARGGAQAAIPFDRFCRGFYTGHNASYVARQLVEQGLVEKWTSPYDKRVALLRLTEAGLAWCDEMAALLDERPGRDGGAVAMEALAA